MERAEHTINANLAVCRIQIWYPLSFLALLRSPLTPERNICLFSWQMGPYVHKPEGSFVWCWVMAVESFCESYFRGETAACLCLPGSDSSSSSEQQDSSKFFGPQNQNTSDTQTLCRAEENCTVENKFSVQVYITYCVLLHLPLINNTHQSISTLLAAGVNCAWS